MSTERPKRTIIRKKYDDSDGMPWCEERVVRKVLFLSLREFREAQRNQLPSSMQNTHTRPRDLRSRTPAPWALRSHTTAPRDLRSLTPAVIFNGVVANANSQRSTRLSVNGRSGRNSSRGCNGSRNPADRATKRPRLQAQRKFAQSPPSSPGHTPKQTSKHALNLSTPPTIRASDRHSHRPGTEDFLSFLCLRGSVALPSDMTFLGRYQNEEMEDESVISQNSHQHQSTNQRRQPGIKDQNRLISRTALRSSTEAPLTSRTASQMVVGPDNRMSSAPLLRPRRPNQVSMVTGLSRRVTSRRQNLSQAMLIRGSSKIVKMPQNTKTSSPSASRVSNSCHCPGNRSLHLRSCCHRPGNPHYRPGSTDNSLSKTSHAAKISPCSHSKPCPLLKKPSSLFYVDIPSGTSCTKTSSLTPLSSRTTNRQRKGQPSVLRESRRRMGLPPETSSASLVITPLTRGRKLRCHVGGVRLNRAGHCLVAIEHEEEKMYLNKQKHNKAGCHAVEERQDEVVRVINEKKRFEAGHRLSEKIQEEAKHSVGLKEHMDVGNHVSELRQEKVGYYIRKEKQACHNVGNEGCMEEGSHAGKEKEKQAGCHAEQRQSEISYNVCDTRQDCKGLHVSEAKKDGVGLLVGEHRQDKADRHVSTVSSKPPREQRSRRGQDDPQVKPAVTRLRSAYTPVTRSTVTSIPANTPASKSTAPVKNSGNNSSRNISKNTSRSKCTTSATKTRTSPRTSRA